MDDDGLTGAVEARAEQSVDVVGGAHVAGAVTAGREVPEGGIGDVGAEAVPTVGCRDPRGGVGEGVRLGGAEAGPLEEHARGADGGGIDGRERRHRTGAAGRTFFGWNPAISASISGLWS